MSFLSILKRARLLFFAFVFALIFVFSSKSVQASEGTFTLSGTNVVCDGISVWSSNRYNMNGRCSGLVYPFAEQLDNYVIWVKNENGEFKKVGKVDNGIINGNFSLKFSELLITAETSSSPRTPSTNKVVSGNIKSFDFSTKPTTQETIIQTEPTSTPVATKAPVLETKKISDIFPKGTITAIILFVIVIAGIFFFIRRR